MIKNNHCVAFGLKSPRLRNRAELLRKYDNDEELTVAEIKECQRLIKPINHTSGKLYGIVYQ